MIAAAYGACLFGSSLTAAQQIPQYQQLRNQLLAGAAVTSLFYPHQCAPSGKPETAVERPNLLGGLKIQEFMVIPQNDGERIAYSSRHFTIRPDGTPTIEFIQYQVMSNGSAAVSVQALSPTTYQPLPGSATPAIYQCTLGKGLRFSSDLTEKSNPH
ncbi:hypothetical protein WS67_11320 [Burkholderia singularis]|uniref:VirK protein n=1 Tax=Burkholderia singularis TaxID=1503053 RepID=A0A118DP52_9BURK|nr:VirK family protein [Burkholderia singularis]KVE27518.1 hypothetical protein WS67_11320 [Burkholderia singularis]